MMANFHPPKRTHQPNHLPKTLVAIAGVVVIGAGGLAIKNTANGSRKTGSDQALSTVNATPIAADSVFKDGTYSSMGSYTTPENNETLNVTITLQNNLITDATVSGSPKTRESKQYQAQFIAGYKSLVVGKRISDVHLSRVSGSSLTSGGFNRALENIKSQSKA